MPEDHRTRVASTRATGWGCAAALAGFAAPFAVVVFALPPVLGAFIRWRGDYGKNDTPESLAILTMMVAAPLLFFLAFAVGLVLAVVAFNLVSRRLDPGFRPEQST